MSAVASATRLDTPRLPTRPAARTRVCDDAVSRDEALAHCNHQFETLTPRERVEWSLTHLPGNHILSSSFGAQAAVSLHLVTEVYPDIPVLLIDTGYLFPETYHFVDELTERLKLNLKVYRSSVSPAWQEARYGQRWQQGVDGIDDYKPGRGSSACAASRARAARRSPTSTWPATAGKSTPSPTGPIATCTVISRSMTSRITRCGRKAMCRSVIGTARGRFKMPASRR